MAEVERPKKKGYDFTEVEPKIMQLWEDQQTFKFDTENVDKEIFSLDIPPPTISGRLHMGHAFGDSQQDFIARYKRMRGFNVLNPFGTDNNGLPTLKLVEKEKKVRSKDMTREEFIELCRTTIEEEFIPQFLNDAKRLGLSSDWDLFYSTIDKRSRRISQKSFIDLYNKGREYRVESPSLWCTKCQTTIAQVELEDVNKDTTFNDIIFKIGDEDLVIATTRPELLPACVSIFVNPNDEKFKDVVGKMAKVPLFDFEVPIMTDEKADPEKGTGAVMCCTFGDQTDMEWQREYKLEIKEAIAPYGKMTAIAGKYEGMKIEEARKAVIQDLKDAGLLIHQENISHDVNTHERCGTPIEFINSKQWFIKYLDLKEDMLKWGEEIKWYPDFMKHRFFNWVRGLKWDWGISRQIPFGIPFPVWYCASCDEAIMAEEKDLPVDPTTDSAPVEKCPKCGCHEFVPEKDIMNTWATSSLTPEIIKDLLKDTPVYDKIKDVPMSVRRNGHDIITFWDFNTVVKSRLHYNRNPWNELMINGWMLGKDGKKMSKSRNNGIAPQDTIEQWGSDVLRYLCATSKLGEDLAFPEAELTAGKKTVTKLFNATKFVFMNLEDYRGEKPEKLEKIDELFLNKLNSVVKICTESFDKYEYSKAKAEVETLFWKDFCDNYLEIVKKRVYQGERVPRLSAQYTLHKTLLTILKLFAPIMPFVTEEIYQTYFKKTEKVNSIHISSWPEFSEVQDFEGFDKFVEILGRVRSEKTTAQKSMNSEIISTLNADDTKAIEGMENDFKSVTNSKELQLGEFSVEFLEKSE